MVPNPLFDSMITNHNIHHSSFRRPPLLDSQKYKKGLASVSKLTFVGLQTPL
jgi:hypothetical protein